jgi:hypothetical protein
VRSSSSLEPSLHLRVSFLPSAIQTPFWPLSRSKVPSGRKVILPLQKELIATNSPGSKGASAAGAGWPGAGVGAGAAEAGGGGSAVLGPPWVASQRQAFSCCCLKRDSICSLPFHMASEACGFPFLQSSSSLAKRVLSTHSILAHCCPGGQACAASARLWATRIAAM